MSDEPKNRVWDIDVVQRVLHKRVCFDEPVTEVDAIDLFLEGAYYDILDMELGEVEEVLHASMVGDADEDEDEDEDGYDKH